MTLPRRDNKAQHEEAGHRRGFTLTDRLSPCLRAGPEGSPRRPEAVCQNDTPLEDCSGGNVLQIQDESTPHEQEEQSGSGAEIDMERTNTIGLNQTVSMGAPEPDPSALGDQVPQLSRGLVPMALLQVDRKHAPRRASTERGVLDVVVEHQQVAGRRLESDGRYLRSANAPRILVPIVR